jgi:hypothetical protein
MKIKNIYRVRRNMKHSRDDYLLCFKADYSTAFIAPMDYIPENDSEQIITWCQAGNGNLMSRKEIRGLIECYYLGMPANEY